MILIKTLKKFHMKIKKPLLNSILIASIYSVSSQIYLKLEKSLQKYM
jgi:hypothetical protein